MREPIDTSKIKFRCSALGQIMTNGRTKDAGMGETAKGYAEQRVKEILYHRIKEFGNKFTEKGLCCEEDAITLLSRVKGVLFKKNEHRIENDFLTGTPDIYLGESIEKADEGWDTKASWSVWTFPMFEDKLDKNYYYQAMGYMALTGAKRWTIAYTLVNATPSLLDNEKKSLYFKMNLPAEDNLEYVQRCIDIEKNLIFDMPMFKKQYPHYDFTLQNWDFDIPIKERLKEFVVERDEAVIASIYQRVGECRAYIKTLL